MSGVWVDVLVETGVSGGCGGGLLSGGGLTQVKNVGCQLVFGNIASQQR